MNAQLNLIPWLVVAPVLAALVAPLLGFPLRGRPRHQLNAILELILLVLAVAAARSAPGAYALSYGSGTTAGALVLSLDRPASVGIVLLAVLFLAISAFSCGFLGTARSGSAFLSLLLLEQAAANLILLAANLFTLYLGLFLLALSLMLLVGIDFTPASGRAALRTFATPEVPAAIALVSYWLIATRSGTSSFADLPGRATWLADPSTTLLVLPIALALVARTGLFPFQRWVILSSRASAAPGAVAIGAIAVPLGGYALWRVVLSALPLAPDWSRVIAILGALTVIVAGVAALRERSAMGWLAYAALAQVGVAVVGLSAGGAIGNAGGWLALVYGGVAVALLGLSLGLLTRTTREDLIGGPASLPRDWLSRLALGLGFLSVAGFPPLPTFTARQALLAGLLSARSAIDYVVAALIVVGTLLFAAAAWKALIHPVQTKAPGGNGHRLRTAPREPELVLAGTRVAHPSVPVPPTPPPSREELRAVLRGSTWAIQHAGVPEVEWEARWTLGALLVLIVGASFVAPASLAGALGLPFVPPAFAFNLAATIILLLVLGGALVLVPAWSALGARLPARKRVTRRFVWLGERLHLGDLTDPYLVVGSLVVLLGQVAAEILDNTLGRMARIG